jgi:zinc protease
MLASMQMQDLGIDHLETRNGYIEAVTPEDVVRVSKRLFTRPILFSVVGDPEGLEHGTTP